ncbi:redoxin domain-containing protein [Patescibacteria group bacterium]|nr:redoxin domain-containing protein [Patescibacteria group bacterium]
MPKSNISNPVNECCGDGDGCCQEESCCCGNCAPKIDHKAPEFTAQAYYQNEEKKISLSDYKGKWLILFFYPKDFTFVCPTELGDLADRYEELKKLNTEVLSVSTDTIPVHKAWFDASETIQKIKFPMVADPTHEICRKYGVLIEEEGIALRGTYIISPDGEIKTIEIHGDGVGRSGNELLRKLQAAQFVAKYGDQVCPANWEPGKDTLKPGMDLVGKI